MRKKKVNSRENTQETRNKFSLDDFCTEHAGAIIGSVVLLIFLCGFLVSWFVLVKPSSDSQFEMYEEVAQYVYEHQEETDILDIPGEVSISITKSSIVVRSSSKFDRGYVVAKLRNGELVTTRYPETGAGIFCCLLISNAFAIGSLMLLGLIGSIIESIKK